MESDGSIEKKIRKARTKYLSYDDDVWHKALFDEETGGYVVVNKDRRHHVGDSLSERRKYAKEFVIARVLAHYGYNVEMLREDDHFQSHDANLNGIPAEFKRTRGSNNIRKYAKKGIMDQKATIVVFQLDENTESVQWELLKLKRHGYKILYFFTGEEKVHIL